MKKIACKRQECVEDVLYMGLISCSLQMGLLLYSESREFASERGFSYAACVLSILVNVSSCTVCLENYL